MYIQENNDNAIGNNATTNITNNTVTIMTNTTTSMSATTSSTSVQTTDNNISKQELALIKAGATRERGAAAIAEALVATKMTIDKYGEEHIEPDHAMRLRAEEIRAKMVGDIKPDGGVVNNSVVIGISADEFKALLMTARKNVVDVKIENGGQSGDIEYVDAIRA